MILEFTVNGRNVCVDACPGARLSEVLRESLSLTGTKSGCDAGDCGACTVIVDGSASCACLVAAGQIQGTQVTSK